MNPSIMKMLPFITPEFIDSSESRPISTFSRSRRMLPSNAAESERAFIETASPGVIIVPRTFPFLSTTVIVVAVPMSSITSGADDKCKAAATLQTISEPSCSGFFILMPNPVFLPSDIIKGFLPQSFAAAAQMISVSSGTTDETTAQFIIFSSVQFFS